MGGKQGARVYISCDIEGITGVVSLAQAGSQGSEYERARRAMTGDVNAAVLGALEAGAELVVVNDGHGPMTNLILDDLHPAAEVILGSPKPLTQMEGVRSGFDLAMLVGYHARMGSNGVLSHTISGGTVQNVWLNGLLVGETGINSAIAGAFGVPIGLVTGDQWVCAEARALLPNVHTVEVKQAITRYAARCLHPQRTAQLIRAAAAAAVAGRAKLSPLVVSQPVTFRIEFKDSGMGDAANRIPGAKVISPSVMECSAESADQAFIVLRGLIGLARA